MSVGRLPAASAPCERRQASPRGISSGGDAAKACATTIAKMALAAHHTSKCDKGTVSTNSPERSIGCVKDSGNDNSADGATEPHILPHTTTEERTTSGDGDTCRELCLVCMEPLRSQICLYACDHSMVCSICAMTIRVVSKDFRCPCCQIPSQSVVIFPAGEGRNYQDYDIDGDVAWRGSLHYDKAGAAFFVDKSHQRFIASLSQLRCAMCSKKQRKTFESLHDLRSHLLQNHEKMFCDLCLENSTVFLQRQRLYTEDTLKAHMVYGGREGPMRGHPRCDLCSTNHYTTSELLKHVYREHYCCHICDHLDADDGRDQEQYIYGTYNDLELHFQAAHWPCSMPSCRANRFIVFAFESDWKQHMAEVHNQPYFALQFNRPRHKMPPRKMKLPVQGYRMTQTFAMPEQEHITSYRSVPSYPSRPPYAAPLAPPPDRPSARPASSASAVGVAAVGSAPKESNSGGKRKTNPRKARQEIREATSAEWARKHTMRRDGDMGKFFHKTKWSGIHVSSDSDESATTLNAAKSTGTR
eukprot:GHVS01097050.1.p1 GENE.GHVS01097050.1~~GHVS01097050.1.p1  ORF type:complete len:592 (-),score=45.11 GHVS01097050.1:435-2018(-)